MNQAAKRAIKSLVLDLRHKLEDDITIQLKRYGFAGERWLPLSRLPHIEEDNQATIERFRLEAALSQHLRRIGADPSSASAKQRAEAVDWFVREVAFTHLNRLAALKCLEVRELIPEIITTRDAYGGRSRAHRDYRNAHPDQARQADDALPAAIRHVCRQVYSEFKFLFDVGDPTADREPPANTILWPSVPVLKACISLINGLDYEAEKADRTLWAEDEIIGWIYQFYNVEEKEAIRDRGRPRRPAEVAVINQFFTPRWIVKFLVDNTLGRLWLEMHPDSQRVRDKCDYLVPEPLGGDETERQGDKGTRRREDKEFELDPNSPINSPDAEPRRDPKTPEELRLIDPACGTMHFGHYAFEVFQEIYEDAIERGWAEPPEESIAASILRHNLYGVDIDLRAVQLAGLSLFIKAKSADPDAHVAHLNLVVADAVLPKDGARRRFLARYDDDKVVQDAVSQVLEEMENVAEVGSLLRVEERLRDILGEAGHAALECWDGDRHRELPGFEPRVRQLSLAETAGARPEEWGAHYTVARLLGDLRQFAAEALQTHDLNAQLFAQEAEKTVHLLDVFLSHYDAVVMNPPYGDFTTSAKEMVEDLYPVSGLNAYSAFVERATELAQNGYVGALTSRSFLTLRSFEGFRDDVILSEGLSLLLDLGWGVLDGALVETCAFVVEAGRRAEPITFWDLREQPEKKVLYESRLGEYSTRAAGISGLYIRTPNVFEVFPRTNLAYWVPETVLDAFDHFRPLGSFAQVKTGIQVPSTTRYFRYWWEVNQAEIGRGRTWVRLANGGAFSPYYRDNPYVIYWRRDGQEIKESPKSYVRNESFYFERGLTWGKRATYFNVQILNRDHIFSSEGDGIFVDTTADLFQLLATLNSRFCGYALSLICGLHKHPGYVAAIPLVKPTDSVGAKIRRLARQAFNLKRDWNTGNEICTGFESPWLAQVGRTLAMGGIDRSSDREGLLAALDQDAPTGLGAEPITFEALLKAVCVIERAGDARLQAIQEEIDEVVYDLYGISEQDRRFIRGELSDQPPVLVWPEMEGKSDHEKRREHVRRLISYSLLQSLKEKRDGILPLCNGAGGTTAVAEIRRRMVETFGEEAAFKMESEIKQILGRDIADWLDGPFIKWHTKLYKKCPIIWQLSSDDYHNTFNCFVYYHALDTDTLQKVRTQYLWPQRRAIQSALESARGDQRDGVSGASSRVEDAEEDLEVLEAFEEKLLSVIEGKSPYTPPDWAEGPIRNGIYDPVLDDGVKVNIMPLQKAGILRYKRLV